MAESDIIHIDIGGFVKVRFCIFLVSFHDVHFFPEC